MANDVFREPALERALTIDDVDQLLALHQADDLRLTTTSGGLLVHDLDPRPLIAAVLRQARFGLILRELAEAPAERPGRLRPGWQSLHAGIRFADDRNRRER